MIHSQVTLEHYSVFVLIFESMLVTLTVFWVGRGQETRSRLGSTTVLLLGKVADSSCVNLEYFPCCSPIPKLISVTGNLICSYWFFSVNITQEILNICIHLSCKCPATGSNQIFAYFSFRYLLKLHCCSQDYKELINLDF